MKYAPIAVLAAILILQATLRAETTELLANPTFKQATPDGIPAGWSHRTPSSGYVKVGQDEHGSLVEIGIVNGPEDSFIQQIVKLPDPRPARLRISVTYRHEGIVPGAKGHERGQVQARFTRDGRDTGNWIGLGTLTGSSADWITQTREVAIPADVDGLMLRMGFYGTNAGKLLVRSASVAPVTQDDLQARREQFRPAEPYGEPVSDARYNRIRHGININGWFCQPWNQSVGGKKGGFRADFFQSYITKDDIAMIRDMGYDHIRLPVDPIFLIELPGGALNTELLGELDRAIAMIREHGLAVIVDIHPKNQTFSRMAEKPEVNNAFPIWWGHFAKHMAETTDPEWVFLELLNEPGGQRYWANQAWNDYQDKLITIVRRNAPKHTIIANGGGYQLVTELDRAQPHPDRNLIWAIHYYEPSPFTHQGAPWMRDWYRPLNQVPWPLTAENLEQTIAQLKGHKARDHAAKVLNDQVNRGYATRAYMEEQIAKIADWSRENNIRVHIGEYGVVDWAPRDSRLRYLRAISEEFEKHGLARAMWNYSGSAYSTVIGEDEPGARVPDTELIEALGLPVKR